MGQKPLDNLDLFDDLPNQSAGRSSLQAMQNAKKPTERV